MGKISGHISGSIAENPVLGLIHMCHSDEMTGILEVKSDGAVRQLFFEKGGLVYATSNDFRDGLAYLLLRVGRISRQQFDGTAALAKSSGKKQGGLLVETGYITPKELFWGVKLQVSEIVFGLMRQEEGEFVFLETPIPRSDIIILKLHTPSLVMEGLRRLVTPAHVEWTVGPLDSVVRPLQYSPGWLGPEVLTDEERKVWALVQEGQEVQKVLEGSDLPQEMTLRVICTLIDSGMAERAGAAEEIHVVEKVDTEEVRAQTAAFHESLKRKNHYQVLGLPGTATSREVKLAYLKFTKKYHPDCHAAPELQDLKPVFDDIFTRLTLAYDVLMDEVKKREYDMFLAISAPPIRVSAQPRGTSPGADLGTPDPARAKDQFEKAMAEYKRGNYWGALDGFQWAVRLHSSCALYHVSLGNCLAHMPRRTAEAEDHYKRALEVDHFNVDALLALGGLCQKMGRKEEAESQYKKVLQWDPANPRALAALGMKAPKRNLSNGDDPEKGLFGKIFGK